MFSGGRAKVNRERMGELVLKYSMKGTQIMLRFVCKVNVLSMFCLLKAN